MNFLGKLPFVLLSLLVWTPSTLRADTSSTTPRWEEICDAVEANSRYLSHGRFKFVEEMNMSDGYRARRSGDVQYSGDYYSVVSHYDEKGQACAFVGELSSGWWLASNVAALESEHKRENAAERRATLNFGRAGPPFILERTSGTTWQTLRGFLLERQASGASIEVRPAGNELWGIAAIGNSQPAGKENSRPEQTFRVRVHKRNGIMEAFQSGAGGRIFFEFSATNDCADESGFLIPKRIQATYYGNPGVEPSQSKGRGEWTNLIEIQQFLPVQTAVSFDATALKLPAGVQLRRTNLDGTTTISISRADGSLKPVEVRPPQSDPFASTGAWTSTSRDWSRSLAISAFFLAIIGILYLSIVTILNRRNWRNPPQ